MKIISQNEAISALLAGQVGVLPTDTVYGLVTRAANPAAVQRFYGLKQREHKPGTVIAASVDQLIELGVPEQYLRRVERWWPASLSVEMPLDEKLGYLHQETGRQAFRVVDDEGLRGLLTETGPLVTTSANRPGEPASVSVTEAQAYFGEAVDFYLDGGDRSGRQPSTIVGFDGNDDLIVYRQGAVDISTLD